MARSKVSAGVLAVRERGGELEFFLVHPGGPFFRAKDAGAWSVPKGLIEPGEDPLAAAQRELIEETGYALPAGPWVALGFIDQKGGKRVHAWAVAADFDPDALRSEHFELEWPPRSGRIASFPEVDRAGWFGREAAGEKINAAQIPLLDRATSKRRELRVSVC